MKAVIDTNIFISSFFGGNPRRIIDLWREEKLTLCLSKDILDEYIEVLGRIGLEGEDELHELLSLFSRGFNLIFTSKTPTINAVEADPDDNKFIECAVALRTDVIITGDKALGEVKAYKGIKILTPAQFLKDYDIKK